MIPFSTTAMTEHLLTHISHVVGMSSRSASFAGGWLNGLMYARDAPTAAVAAPAAENLRNFLRSIYRLFVQTRVAPAPLILRKLDCTMPDPALPVEWTRYLPHVSGWGESAA